MRHGACRGLPLAALPDDHWRAISRARQRTSAPRRRRSNGSWTAWRSSRRRAVEATHDRSQNNLTHEIAAKDIRHNDNDTGERAWAEAALDGNAAELAACGEGGRNHALNAKAYRMGRMVARGWIEKSRVEAALTDACRANGLFKDDGPKGVRDTLASGLRGGMAKPCADLDDARDDELLAEGNRIAGG